MHLLYDPRTCPVATGLACCSGGWSIHTGAAHRPHWTEYHTMYSVKVQFGRVVCSSYSSGCACLLNSARTQSLISSLFRRQNILYYWSFPATSPNDQEGMTQTECHHFLTQVRRQRRANNPFIHPHVTQGKYSTVLHSRVYTPSTKYTWMLDNNQW